MCCMDMPKSLYEYFKINVPVISKDVNTLLAATIVGRGGWWYTRNTIYHDDAATAVAINPQASRVVTGYSIYRSIEPDETVYADLWDIETCGWKRGLAHGNDVKVATCSASGSRFATGSNNGSVYLWDAEGTLQASLPYAHPVSAMAFNQSETHLAAGFADGSIDEWDITQERPSKMRRWNLDGRVNALAVHPTNQTILAVGLENKKTLILDPTKSTHLQMVHDDSVKMVAFNRQGTRMLVATWDKRLLLYDLEGLLIAKTSYENDIQYAGFLYGEDAQITQDTVLKDLHAVRVITWSKQGTCAYICDYAGNKMRTLQDVKDLQAIAVRPTGGLLATACNTNTVVWEQHTNPTLEQVLLRIVLDDLSKGCKFSGQDVGIKVEQHDALPQIVASKCNLNEDEIRVVWSTFPVRLRKSIILTLLYRAQKALARK